MYIETTLRESLHVGHEEQKVPGMCWRLREDILVFDVSAISQLADNWELTKHIVICIIRSTEIYFL